jgi:aspartate-semialdehyde dehydrogenase
MDKTASFTVGIVGATGAVGQELLRLMEGRGFPVSSLRLFASARSVGKTLKYSGRDISVEEATPECSRTSTSRSSRRAAP